MAKLKIKYVDGSEETIENAFTIIDHGEREISYFIGAGLVRYHAIEVVEHEIIED